MSEDLVYQAVDQLGPQLKTLWKKSTEFRQCYKQLVQTVSKSEALKQCLGSSAKEFLQPQTTIDAESIAEEV